MSTPRSLSISDVVFTEQFPTAWEVLNQLAERGLYSGVQLYVSYDAKPLANISCGVANANEPLTPSHRMLWLSSGKPLAAVLIGQLWEQRILQIDDPVCRWIPEFEQHGKGPITIRHLLTHTAGFRTVDTGWPDAPWKTVIEKICAAPLDSNWEIGKTAGYHLVTSWFILGEIVRRITGQAIPAAIEAWVLSKAGMGHTSQSLLPVGARAMPVAPMYWRHQGEITPLDWHLPPRSEAISLGSNTWGPIADLGRFYETMLAAAAGLRPDFLTAPTAVALTSPQRVGEFDLTLQHKVDFGLGFIVCSNRYGADTVPYGFGTQCSPRGFGHGGSQSSVGFADPERKLVVAYAFNTMCGEGQHQRRAKQLNDALEADLAKILV